MMLVTTETISGMRITKTLGLVRGSSIRARHIGRDIMAGLRNIVGGEILEYAKLIGESREQAGDEFLFREIDQIRVKGKTRPERVYELMAIAAEADDDLKRLAEAYGKALMQYRSLEFEAAMKTLTFVVGGDGPSQWMLKQCAHFKSDPPDDDWTGITKMREK